MEAIHYNYHIGYDREIFYGASITDADLIMSDGRAWRKWESHRTSCCWSALVI